MSFVGDLLKFGLADPETAHSVVRLFAIMTGILIAALILKSFENTRNIRRVEDPQRRFELLSQERNARATTYGTAIVLAGAIFGYYQFVYGKQEKDSDRFEKATAILYASDASPPARIRAMDQLATWATGRGPEGQDKIAGVIADGLRVWAEKIDFKGTCKNDRSFNSHRIGSDTKHAIDILKKMKDRTVFLDFSELALQDADFSGADENNRVKLQFADFHSADLSGAKLNFTDLQGADFYCANLYAAELKGSLAKKPEPKLPSPPEVATKRAELNFSTNFVRSRMQWAKLQGANFTSANLIDADLKNATVDGRTKFDGADMRHAILESLMVDGKPTLAGTNLEGACVDEGTAPNLKAADLAKARVYSLSAPPPECVAPTYGKNE